MSDESTVSVGHSDTFIATIESVDDVNKATRRVNSFLNDLRQQSEQTEARIVVAEVDDV